MIYLKKECRKLILEKDLPLVEFEILVYKYQIKLPPTISKLKFSKIFNYPIKENSFILLLKCYLLWKIEKMQYNYFITGKNILKV